MKIWILTITGINMFNWSYEKLELSTLIGAAWQTSRSHDFRAVTACNETQFSRSSRQTRDV